MSARKAKTPRVVIRIDSGCITVVAKPKGVELEVRDYDMQEENNRTKIDDEQNIYEETLYP